VASGEQRPVDARECVGEVIPNDHARLQSKDAAVLLGFLPHSRLTLLDVGLAQGEGQERHFPIRPMGQTGQDVLVGIARKRAAIVPRHCKRCRHGGCNP